MEVKWKTGGVLFVNFIFIRQVNRSISFYEMEIKRQLNPKYLIGKRSCLMVKFNSAF